MTDIVSAQATMTDTADEPKVLTVRHFLESLSGFPLDSEVVASMVGIQLTIPVVGAVVVNSREGKQLTVLQISTAAAKRALMYADKILEEQSIAVKEIIDGEAVN